MALGSLGEGGSQDVRGIDHVRPGLQVSLLPLCPCGLKPPSMSDIVAVIQSVLERAPKWIKADLMKEGQELRRAEETLAAMIAIAIDRIGNEGADVSADDDALPGLGGDFKSSSRGE